MTRTYDRETIRWDLTALKRLEAEGKAQYFPGLPGYVVTLPEGGKVAVRNHQIDDPAAERAIASPRYQAVQNDDPMAGYSAKENYDGEDLPPHGVVYANALRLAEEYVEVCAPDQNVMAIVRKILDDEDGEFAHALGENIYDQKHAERRIFLLDKFTRKEN